MPRLLMDDVSDEAQEFSIPSSAASPWTPAPLPTLVGMAIAGPEAMQPTTRGNAPSMPALTVATVPFSGERGLPAISTT